MKKLIFMGGLLLTLVIIACSGGGGNGKVTLEWWQFWTDPAIKPTIEKMVADYEAAHPDIKINLTDLTWANGHEKIVVAFSSGTAPDIIELGSDWVPEFIAAGQLADITTLVVGDTGAFRGWSPALRNGSIYAHPWILGTRTLFINNDLMKQAGYKDGYVPVKWDDLRQLCYRIDSLGKEIHGFGSNAAEKHRLYKKFLPFFWSAGGKLLSPDGRYALFASDPAYKALQFYKELSDSCALVDTQRRLDDAFLEGTVGVIISGDWLLKRIRNEQRDIDFTTALIPGPEYPGKSFAGGEYLAVSTASAHRADAVDFIRHITNQANQLAFCRANYSASPSHRAAGRDEFFNSDPHLQLFIKQLNLSQMPPAIPQWVAVEDIIERALEEILFNEAPVAETLYEANKSIQEVINRK